MNNQNGLVKDENYVMGALGAILGSLAGVAVIVLLNLVGFVASLAGVVMGAATFALYEKFAGKISKTGIIICVIVMIIMVVVGENLAISIALAKEFHVSVFDIFFRFYEILKSSSDAVREYIIELVMVYAFTALGAFGIIRDKMELIKKN